MMALSDISEGIGNFFKGVVDTIWDWIDFLMHWKKE